MFIFGYPSLISLRDYKLCYEICVFHITGNSSMFTGSNVCFLKAKLCLQEVIHAYIL